MSWRLLTGDVREQLQTLAPASVQTCVTSPPYWGLRDYGHAGQIGAEPTPDAYVAALVGVFAEVWRVLKPNGTLWLNLGDSYASEVKGSGGQGKSGLRRDGRPEASRIRSADLSIEHQKFTPRSVAHGLKAKDLCGIPWRVAFGLQAAGWYLRSDIIWSKPNPMPESVMDRPTKAHEYLFLLSKAERYFYDADAIREVHLFSSWTAKADLAGTTLKGRHISPPKGGTHLDRQDAGTMQGESYHPLGRNKRSVWTVATQPYAGAHFATFPEALITPCILAASRIGDLVLDPFTGSGTTGAVAIRHQRSFVGCELNPDYVQLARTRIGGESPLFAVEVA